MILPLGTGPFAAGAEPPGDVADVGSAALPVRVFVVSPATKTLGVRVSVVASGILSGSSAFSDGGTSSASWTVQVEIGGSDVSSSIVGDVVIEAEESAARIADMELCLTPGGSVSPASWVGKPVVIYFSGMSGGVPVGAMLLFSGRVDLPVLGSRSRNIALRCTDNRQDVIAGMTKEDIAALLPVARFSPAVFDSGARSLEYAGDLLSTVPQAIDLSPAGAIRVTQWPAKSTADLSFSDDQVLDQSVSVDIAQRSEVVNLVSVDFGYRLPRIKSEGYGLIYDYLDLNETDFGYWIRDGNNLLQRAAVVAAIEKTGASIVSITWTELPTTAQIIPGTGGATAGAWLPNPLVDTQFCLGFSAVVSFDYSQQIDEAHKITVQNAASISALGAMRYSMSGALEGVYDDTVAIEQSILLYRQEVTKIPPKNVAPVVVGKTNSVDGLLTGDSNRAAANAAMEALIAVASTKIYDSHRRHSVSAAVPCNPVIDVDKTVSINAQGVVAKGKVRRVVHRLSPSGGDAITEFDLAICRAAGVGIAHPEDTITAPDGTTAGITSTLDDAVITWNGLAGQDNIITIEFPGVADAERDRSLVTIESVFAAPLYEDVLEITSV